MRARLKEFMDNAKKEIEKIANPERAKLCQRFFRTGKGEYGEGDVFLGIAVPKIREIVRACWKQTKIKNIKSLINSKFHEERLAGLLILIEKFKKADDKERKEIFEIYLEFAEKGRINNWDLVDLSAPNIVGNYLADKDRKVIYDYAESGNLWKKRIAVLACFSFIRQKDFKEIIRLAEYFIKNNERHDLMQKAVGWMLRELGKRDEKALKDFLDKNYLKMPRTMLRYSIERLSEDDRKRFMGS
jgi:3-methyladenine DNA glycosylase AlkD